MVGETFDVNETRLYSGFGVQVSTHRMMFSAAVPSLSSIGQDSNEPADLILNGGYRADLNQLYSLYFSGLARFARRNPNELEGSISLQYFDQFSLGLGYLKGNGPIILMGMRFQNGLEINYAYDTNATNAIDLGSSHEIQLSYHLSLRRLFINDSRICLGGRWKDYYYYHPAHR